MRGQLAGDAEIAAGADEAGAVELLPETIDGDAGHERMLGTEQPLREAEAILGQFIRQGGKGGGSERFHFVAALVVFTAVQDEGDGLRRLLVHHVGDGAAGFDVDFFLSELFELGIEGAAGSVDRGQIPVLGLGLFFRGALVRLFGDEFFDGFAAGELSGFLRGEAAAEEAQIADREELQAALGVSLADFEGNGGADGALELVGGDSGGLQLAVVIDAHAAGLFGAVVGHADVGPLLGDQGSLRDDLQRVVLPFARDVGADFVAFEPEVPAAMVGFVIHAGEDRAGLVAAAELDPEAGREALIGFEVADICNFDGGRGLQAEGLLLFVAGGGPGDGRFAGDFAICTVDGQLERLAFAFVERARRTRPSRGTYVARSSGLTLATHFSNSGWASRLRASSLVRRAATSAWSASQRRRSAEVGTTMIGGVSLMLPSRTAWVVLSKKAERE